MTSQQTQLDTYYASVSKVILIYLHSETFNDSEWIHLSLMNLVKSVPITISTNYATLT